MHISQIDIENFRLFENFHLKFNPGLNVIVGENGSGKSALIDAIRITLDTNSAEWTKISEYDFYKGSLDFKIRLKLENITAAQAHVFIEHLTHERLEAGGRKSVLYINLIANVTDNLHKGSRFIKTEIRSGESAEGSLIERDIRKYLSATYLKPLRDAEAELSAGRGSRLMQILSASKKWGQGNHLESLVTGFVEANLNTRSNTGILEGKKLIDKNFQGLTFDTDKSKFNLAVQVLGCKEFSMMSPGEKRKALQDILERLSLSLNEDIPLQSLGYNNILFMATELLLLEQEEDEFPILLIEEPEAHLHPQLQMKLLKFIRQEYSQGDNPKLQTILSTHSPNLASKASLDNIIFMSSSKAYPMNRGLTKLDNDDYEFLEKFLDVTKSNLFFAKGIIIVEGDAENILLPTIAELLGRPLENFGISIVNVGSTAYARYAKIFMRSGEDQTSGNWIPTKVACLRDLDLWPHKANKIDFPELGFKKPNSKNKNYWVKHQDNSGIELGTDINVKKNKLENFIPVDPVVQQQDSDDVNVAKQNVKVYVSSDWTFEYCIALSPLAKLLYEAIKGNTTGFDELPEDVEERAIKIYGLIEKKSGAKTDVAYKLSKILEREFNQPGKRQELKEKLPKYLVDALEYVTMPWPDNLDISILPSVDTIQNQSNSSETGPSNV